MRRPSARVGLNRRRTFAYLPLLIIGALLFTLALPVLNGVAVFGALTLMAGAGGFVLEADSRY
ncbi:hypothetical protein [Arthrobacter sp. Soil762]|uniref:hypothetical protein n=1 Tax=Arthrobacter sp. Soil762 TaxID=1736401 RepID=UPI000700E5ED|nr:hypothetical protein [Arthrobacter sp. Soil762]KRE72608.1 hypothetical protein ASG77_08020 [Arthrobacter sp. Soil762]